MRVLVLLRDGAVALKDDLVWRPDGVVTFLPFPDIFDHEVVVWNLFFQPFLPLLLHIDLQVGREVPPSLVVFRDLPNNLHWDGALLRII